MRNLWCGCVAILVEPSPRRTSSARRPLLVGPQSFWLPGTVFHQFLGTPSAGARSETPLGQVPSETWTAIGNAYFRSAVDRERLSAIPRLVSSARSIRPGADFCH